MSQAQLSSRYETMPTRAVCEDCRWPRKPVDEQDQARAVQAHALAFPGHQVRIVTTSAVVWSAAASGRAARIPGAPV